MKIERKPSLAYNIPTQRELHSIPSCFAYNSFKKDKIRNEKYVLIY